MAVIIKRLFNITASKLTTGKIYIQFYITAIKYDLFFGKHKLMFNLCLRICIISVLTINNILDHHSINEVINNIELIVMIWCDNYTLGFLYDNGYVQINGINSYPSGFPNSFQNGSSSSFPHNSRYGYGGNGGSGRGGGSVYPPEQRDTTGVYSPFFQLYSLFRNDNVRNGVTTSRILPLTALDNLTETNIPDRRVSSLALLRANTTSLPTIGTMHGNDFRYVSFEYPGAIQVPKWVKLEHDGVSEYVELGNKYSYYPRGRHLYDYTCRVTFPDGSFREFNTDTELSNYIKLHRANVAGCSMRDEDQARIDITSSLIKRRELNYIRGFIRTESNGLVSYGPVARYIARHYDLEEL